MRAALKMPPTKQLENNAIDKSKPIWSLPEVGYLEGYHSRLEDVHFGCRDVFSRLLCSSNYKV